MLDGLPPAVFAPLFPAPPLGQVKAAASPLRPVAPALTIHLRGCGGIVFLPIKNHATLKRPSLAHSVSQGQIVQTAAVPTVSR